MLRRHGFITDDEEDMLVQLEGGVTLPGDGTPMESFLPGKGAPRTKEADFSLGIKETLPGFIGVFTPSRPVLVMECGVSERNRDLSADAMQWLQRSGNIVRCVILVRIQEGPRTAFVQENSDSDSDSSNMAKYQLKEASFFQNQELTAQWAGELSAYAEIWRMNMEVERAEQQCHLSRPEDNAWHFGGGAIHGGEYFHDKLLNIYVRRLGVLEIWVLKDVGSMDA
ncbi:hypothetical protein BGX38DRAFT_1274143 [Terfezia claveryi]|nr:hypothetical protein BGX38DRAFT_1274143 [Terfezia claveryi]